jgi:hypothetical protein
LKRQLIVAEMRNSLSASEVPSDGAYPHRKVICNGARNLNCAKILRQIRREQLPFQG